jgi:hypothetical protein
LLRVRLSLAAHHRVLVSNVIPERNERLNCASTNEGANLLLQRQEELKGRPVPQAALVLGGNKTGQPWSTPVTNEGFLEIRRKVRAHGRAFVCLELF